MDNDIKKMLGEVVQHVDIKFQETQRHFEVLTEHLDSRVELIFEQYGSIQKTLDKHTEILDSHTETLEKHSVILDIHTEVLNRHSQILDKHTETLDSHTEMIGSLKEDVEDIKEEIKSINQKLDKKVDKTEFILLEKRVSAFEA